MSPEPFRLRYAERVAGTLVLAVAVALVGALAMVGQSRRWFTPVRRLTLQLPPEGSLGLRRGADVMILGTVVGTVEDITADRSGGMTAQARVRQDFAPFVRSDSTAVIRRTLGIGDAYVEIKKGVGSELPAENAAILVSPDRAPTQMVEDTVEQIRAEAVPALRQLRAAADEYAALAAELRRPDGSLQQVLARANRVATALDEGRGFAGRLVTDPKLADDLSAAGPRLNASLDDARGLLRDLRAAAAELPAVAGQTRKALREAEALLADVRKPAGQLPRTVESVNRAAEALPGLILQTEESLRQIQRLAEGAQRHWLVRPYVQDDGAGADRVRPERVERGGGSPR